MANMFRNLILPEYQEKSFYHALRTKGFVILAGLSGTGKTKIFEEMCARGETREVDTKKIIMNKIKNFLVAVFDCHNSKVKIFKNLTITDMEITSDLNTFLDQFLDCEKILNTLNVTLNTNNLFTYFYNQYDNSKNNDDLKKANKLGLGIHLGINLRTKDMENLIDLLEKAMDTSKADTDRLNAWGGFWKCADFKRGFYPRKKTTKCTYENIT